VRADAREVWARLGDVGEKMDETVERCTRAAQPAVAMEAHCQRCGLSFWALGPGFCGGRVRHGTRLLPKCERGHMKKDISLSRREMLYRVLRVSESARRRPERERPTDSSGIGFGILIREGACRQTEPGVQRHLRASQGSGTAAPM